MNPAYVWAIAGLVLCLMEIFIPSAFVESALGLSAFAVALVAWFIPVIWVQVVLWLLLSVVLMVWFQGLARGRRRIEYELDDCNAKTVTAIPQGKTGRVMYEGALWPARAVDPDEAIGADQTVQVVRQKGNLLIVMPDEVLL